MSFGMNIFMWLGAAAYVLTCLFLCMIVLMQEGKSGGLGQADSVSQAPGAFSDTFGAGGAQKGLFNTTGYAAAIFFLLALGLTMLGAQKEQSGGNLDVAASEAEQTETGQTAEEPLVAPESDSDAPEDN